MAEPTLCRTTVSLAGAGPFGTLIMVDLEDLGQATSWIEKGIVVPVETEPPAPIVEELAAAETPVEPEAVAPDPMQ